MSRGLGRLQRRILALLEAHPDRRLSRCEIDAVLVEEAGHNPSNVLRAIRGLRRMRRVGLSEGRSLDYSHVSLASRVEPVSDEEVFALLAKVGDGDTRANR